MKNSPNGISCSTDVNNKSVKKHPVRLRTIFFTNKYLDISNWENGNHQVPQNTRNLVTLNNLKNYKKEKILESLEISK